MPAAGVGECRRAIQPAVSAYVPNEALGATLLTEQAPVEATGDPHDHAAPAFRPVTASGMPDACGGTRLLTSHRPGSLRVPRL
jgi:hypothetical protein